MVLLKKNDNFDVPLYASALFRFYFHDLKIGVFDIETTGLSPERASFILGGLASFSENTLEQYFADTLSEEAQLLEAFLQRLSGFHVLITYNGNSFDLPFLLRRAEKLNVPVPKNMPYPLDLYAVLNGHSSLRKFLPNLKQKTVENFMGLWTSRTDEISGAESVSLYLDYLMNKDPQKREVILLHNKDDVLQLSRLLSVLEKANLQKAMHAFGFPLFFKDGKHDVTVQKILIERNKLSVSGKQGGLPIEYHSYGNQQVDYLISFTKNTEDFSIQIPLEHARDTFYVDLRPLISDFSPLKKYSKVQEDYLIIKEKDEIHYLELHHFIQLFIKEIEVIAP